MKFAAFLLALTVMFLALKPGLQLATACDSEIECCTDSCEPFNLVQKQNADSDQKSCNGNSCNPFQSCSASFVLNDLETLSTNEKPQIPTKSIFAYQFNHISLFSSEFWQPPQWS